MTMRIDRPTERRLEIVRHSLQLWDADALLVNHPPHRRWLSGFNGSAGQLLVTVDKAILATDFRYWETAQVQAPGFELFRQTRRGDDLDRLVAASSASRIAVEARHVSMSEFAALKRVAGVNWVPVQNGLEQFRKIKDAAELTAIRAAAAVADEAMGLVNRLARPGMSERALAWEIERHMRESHAVRLAFPVTVASGPNSAFPHHQPGERLLEVGDALIVDLGAEIEGYKSDLTRSFYLGDPPDETYWRIYDLVSAAQLATVEGARPGMNPAQMDALGRDLIAKAGYGASFGHGMGHGIGLEVHEEPFLSPHAKPEETPLAVGTTLTVEPGIYLPGWGGIRIEDLILMGSAGPESLSKCQKTPTIPLS